MVVVVVVREMMNCAEPPSEYSVVQPIHGKRQTQSARTVYRVEQALGPTEQQGCARINV